MHNCHCALKTSGLACNLFCTALVVNPLCGFTTNIRRVPECSLKGIGHPTSVRHVLVIVVLIQGPQ